MSCPLNPICFLHLILRPAFLSVILSRSLRELHPQHLSFKSATFPSVPKSHLACLPFPPSTFLVLILQLFLKPCGFFSYDCIGDTVPNKAQYINNCALMSGSLILSSYKFLKIFDCKIIKDGSERQASCFFFLSSKMLIFKCVILFWKKKM